MLRKAPTFTTFSFGTKEANLLAAKRALKRHRGARLHRDTLAGDDVINIVIGIDIVEQYVCKAPGQLSAAQPVIIKQPVRRPVRIEDLPLYQ